MTLFGLARALVAATALSGSFAFAQQAATPSALRDRFPPSSIDTLDRANDALAATGGTKATIDKDYKAAARACMSTVLVNNCLDRARAERRERMGDVDAVELEANRFKRAEHDRQVKADRSRRETERQANAPADADQRAHNKAAYDQKQADAAKDASARASSETNRAAHPRKPIVQKPASTPSADQRAKNVASLEHKRETAAEHQKDLDRRLVEKEADRKRRAAEKAAKDAKQAAAAKAASDAGK